MTKNSSKKPRSSKRRERRKEDRLTIGMDLGDRQSRYCVMESDGEIALEDIVPTTKVGITKKFQGLPPCRIAIEVGPHSPWVSRLLTTMGHEVIIANARKVQLISASSNKDDRMDARMLARLARVDPALLGPIQHRSEEAQLDLMEIRVRAALVEVRTGLINSARGLESLRRTDPERRCRHAGCAPAGAFVQAIAGGVEAAAGPSGIVDGPDQSKQ